MTVILKHTVLQDLMVKATSVVVALAWLEMDISVKVNITCSLTQMFECWFKAESLFFLLRRLLQSWSTSLP